MQNGHGLGQNLPYTLSQDLDFQANFITAYEESQYNRDS